MMKTKLLLICLMFFLLTGTSGCGNWMCDNLGLFCPKGPTTTPEFNTGEDISQAQSIVEKSTKEIKNATEEISKETQAIKEEIDKTKGAIPVELKKRIDLYLNKINAQGFLFLKLLNKLIIPKFWFIYLQDNKRKILFENIYYNKLS